MELRALSFPVLLAPVRCQRDPKTFSQSLHGRSGRAFLALMEIGDGDTKHGALWGQPMDQHAVITILC